MRKYVARLLVLSLCLCMGCFCSRSNNGKEGTWRGGGKKKRLLLQHFPNCFSRAPLPSELYLSWPFSPPLLPNPPIQHSELQPLIFPCSPDSTSCASPHFPHPLLSQRLSPSLETAVSTGFQFLATICKILWPKEHRSPEAAILILLHGTGVNSEQSSQPCAHTALLGLSLNA